MNWRNCAGPVILIALMLAGGCGKKGTDAQAVYFPDSLVADELLVTVNDYPIRGQDLRVYSSLSGATPVAAQTRSEYNEELLEQYINRVLLWKEAVATGITASDSTVNGFYNQFANSVGGDAAFISRLKEVNISKDEVLQSIRRDLIIREFVMENFVAGETVDSAEVEQYYQKNPERFRTPDEVKARHILIQLSESDNDSTRREKRDRLSQVLDQARSGSDFASLAEKYSDGPSKSRGGDLGYFRRGAMVQPFDSVAFSLKPGEISDIVETRFGFHIIKLEDKRIGHQQTFAAVKDSLSHLMRQEKVGMAIQKHLNEIANLAIIKRNY